MRATARRRPSHRVVARSTARRRHGAPLRVLFVNTPHLPPLGADTWVHARIMEGLDRSTHELHAACAQGPANDPTPAWREFSAIPDIRLTPVDLGRELTSSTGLGRVRALACMVPAVGRLLGLAWYVRRHRIDVIHTSDRPRDAAACVLLARLTGVPAIVHVHVGWADWMSGLLRWSLRQADALVGVSAFVANTLVEAGHDPARTHAVLNAIEADRWTPGLGRVEARAEFAIPADAPVIVTVCRLFPGKGPGDLIHAVAMAQSEHPDVRLLIVGAEMVVGYEHELKALAHDLGLGEHVIFTGRRPDVPRLMAAADIYAMPSLGEPFGLVFAEAMAMQLPVVALDSGGAPEVVEHGRTGLLSEAGDIDALAAHLCVLIAEPTTRAEMGRLGRERVQTYFTVERMARDMAAVYEVVASGPTAQGDDR